MTGINDLLLSIRGWGMHPNITGLTGPRLLRQRLITISNLRGIIRLVLLRDTVINMPLWKNFLPTITGSQPMLLKTGISEQALRSIMISCRSEGWEVLRKTILRSRFVGGGLQQ